ncbi:MAG: TIGR03905 family TSCPD domain-containing protein [Erysipelotrichaceae bacterium]|nr:TIGR03905 family TSCPD domain-containing protein [Erysipelotrichaceae bacterium]
MKSYSFSTQNVCARQLSFDLDQGKIYHVSFQGGCPGNLLAISKLLEGTDAQRAIDILKGNPCGLKQTSCTDQLAIALEQALNEG